MFGKKLLGFIIALVIFSVAALCFRLKINPVEAAQCVFNGGAYRSQMGPIGSIQMECVYQYSDAGKKCTSSTECEGDCLITEDTKFKSTGTSQKEYVSGFGVCEETNKWTGCTAGTIEFPYEACE